MEHLPVPGKPLLQTPSPPPSPFYHHHQHHHHRHPAPHYTLDSSWLSTSKSKEEIKRKKLRNVMRTTALVTPPRASPHPSYLRNVIRERVAYRKIFLGPFYPLLPPPPLTTSVP
ncbi:hypothetical protein HZH66_001020 [Vespula vulgaris]|uniref:Uncharacterized protein n=1 Tax=Vespula vulgaris TaxID=7454 RepID=A0A834KVN5_VESVU|nr:hypothetical protein HZH66_001020 [Vespula vulgaris]